MAAADGMRWQLCVPSRDFRLKFRNGTVGKILAPSARHEPPPFSYGQALGHAMWGIHLRLKALLYANYSPDGSFYVLASMFHPFIRFATLST